MRRTLSWGRTAALALITTALAGGAASLHAQSMDGTWLLTLDTPRGAQEMTVVLTQEGDSIAGTARTQRGELPVAGTFVDGVMKLSMTTTMRDRSFERVFEGEVDPDADMLTITGAIAPPADRPRRGGGRRGDPPAPPSFTMVKQS